MVWGSWEKKSHSKNLEREVEGNYLESSLYKVFVSLIIYILPVWILWFYKFNFPLATPCFQAFFSNNSLIHTFKHFVIIQFFTIIVWSEPFINIILLYFFYNEDSRYIIPQYFIIFWNDDIQKTAMVERTRLELATTWFSSKHSDQLSYRPAHHSKNEYIKKDSFTKVLFYENQVAWW